MQTRTYESLHACFTKRIYRKENQLSILKAPPKQSKNATLQVRIDEDLKAKLEKYAEFLDTTAAYVVSEALELVFNKDAEFKEWLEKQQANDIRQTANVLL